MFSNLFSIIGIFSAILLCFLFTYRFKLLQLEYAVMRNTIFTIQRTSILLGLFCTLTFFLSIYSLNVAYKFVMYTTQLPSFCMAFLACLSALYFYFSYHIDFTSAISTAAYSSTSVMDHLAKCYPATTPIQNIRSSKRDIREMSIMLATFSLIWCIAHLINFILLYVARRMRIIQANIAAPQVVPFSRVGLNTASLRATKIVIAEHA